MMNRFAQTALLLLLAVETGCSLGTTAAASPCHSDQVQTSPGVILALSSGQTYQVFPTDNTISMMWLPLDKLRVCPLSGAAVEITNLTAKDEKVKAVRIYDLPWIIMTQTAS